MKTASEDTGGEMFKDTSIAESYDTHTSGIFGNNFGEYTAIIDFLLGLTAVHPTDFIVDLGCGTGISTARIEERNPDQVIGIDFSEAMLEQARAKFRERENIEFKVASAEELSAIVQNVDKVVSANVFRYFNTPDGVLAEVYKTLRQGGEYLFNVSVVSSEGHNPYVLFFKAAETVLSEELEKEVRIPLPKILQDTTKYDKNTLKELAERHGFAIIKYEERPFMYDEKQLQAMAHVILTQMETEMKKTMGAERTTNILQKIQKKTEEYTQQPLFAGIIAYVCLRKNGEK